MDAADRVREAKEAGYVLLFEDGGQEIYGRNDLPSTRWSSTASSGPLHLRDFNLGPLGHRYLGDAGIHPARAFAALH